MRIGSLLFPALAALTLALPCQAAGAAKSKPKIDAAPAVAPPRAGMKRYMVTRTFPAGALEGLDATAKKSVNKCNATKGVRWVYSYANADKTKTYCIYEAPNEQAIRDAATANKIPVDDIVEIPNVLRAR
jgi:hypothetical protein